MFSDTPAAAVGDSPRPVVLVVDDDSAILGAVKRLLHRSECEVVTASGPVEALAALNNRQVSVVVTDYMMPGMDGIELLILVREKWPAIVSIMMTASNDMRVAADAVNRSLIDYFITKPWENKFFTELVGSALERSRERQPAGTESIDAEPAGNTTTTRELPGFGKYELVELLAKGGMAELYRARLRGAGGFEKDLAVKKILPHLSVDPTFVTMFSDEARIMESLNHGNLVSVIAFGEIEGEYYLVMEYVDGVDLRGLIDIPAGSVNPLPVPEACLIAMQVCRGLDFAHRKAGPDGTPLNIVHRDIAPQNILVSREGMVKISDFGIARSATRVNRTQPGIVRGTLNYMSNEQLCGMPVDRRSDIYSLGVVLYEMVAGRAPLAGATHQETVGRITRGDFLPLNKARPGTGRKLSATVKKALAKDPRHRFQTAAEFEAAIAAFLHADASHVEPADLARLVNQRLTESRLRQFANHRTVDK